jgi:hypothetical protein
MTHRDWPAWVASSCSQFVSIEPRRADSVCPNAVVVLSHSKSLRCCVYSRAGRSFPLTVLSSRAGRRIRATPSSYREVGSKRHLSRPSMVYPTRAVIIEMFRPPVAGHLHPPAIEAAKAPPPPLSLVAEANSPTHRLRNIVRAMADAGAPSGYSH